MKKIIQFISYCIAACVGVVTAQQQENLIPRTVLFGNPTMSSFEVSPDGQQISYLAPYNGVLNIWLATLDTSGKLTCKEPLTKDTHRGIRNYFWAYSSDRIFYLLDNNGDENWLLYSIDLCTKVITAHTPFEKTQVHIAAYEKNYPNTLLLTMNNRDPKYSDLYKLDIPTNKLTLLEKNTQEFAGHLIDHNLKVRGAKKTLKDGTVQLLRKDASVYTVVKTWSNEDARYSSVVGFSESPQHIYVIDTQYQDTAGLSKLNLITGKQTPIFADEEYDVSAIAQDENTHELLWATMNKQKLARKFYSQKYKKLFDRFTQIQAGIPSIISKSLDQTKFIISFDQDNGPVSYYYYNDCTKKFTHLGYSRPDLNNYTLATMQPIQFTSRDGLMVHGYLTLPTHGPQKNLPLVLNVHGGPHLRDSWGYNAEVQWLANRGYAVLQINYRGSKGYGKKFLNACIREWAGKMHDDLLDGIKWVIEQGIADPKKIAIYGGSYGGYAALVGATFTPNVFCCAVDIVGPSNLETLALSIPEYWESYKTLLYQEIGDPSCEIEFLRSRSPLFKIDQIKIPLLIAQGAQDPRVKQAESEQIVAALKKANIPHEYLLFEDEGHGFVKPENRLKFYAHAEKFLAQCLGGRYQKSA